MLRLLETPVCQAVVHLGRENRVIEMIAMLGFLGITVVGSFVVGLIWIRSIEKIRLTDDHEDIK